MLVQVLSLSPDQIQGLDASQRASVIQLVSRLLFSDRPVVDATKLMGSETTIPGHRVGMPHACYRVDPVT